MYQADFKVYPMDRKEDYVVPVLFRRNQNLRDALVGHWTKEVNLQLGSKTGSPELLAHLCAQQPPDIPDPVTNLELKAQLDRLEAKVDLCLRYISTTHYMLDRSYENTPPSTVTDEPPVSAGPHGPKCKCPG